MLSIRSWSWTPEKTTAIATSPTQQAAKKKKRHAVKEKLHRFKFCLCQRFGCKKHTPTQVPPSPPSPGVVLPSNLNKKLPPIRQHSFTVSFDSADRGPGSNDAIRPIAGSHGASSVFDDNRSNREGGKGGPRSKSTIANGGSGAWSPPSSTTGYRYNHSDNNEQHNRQNQVDQHHYQSLDELYDRLPDRRDSRILPIETLDAMYGDSSTAANGINGDINNATGHNSTAACDQSREGPPPYESREPMSHLPGGNEGEQHPALRGGHAGTNLGAELGPQASSPVSSGSSGHMMGNVFDSGPSNLPDSELTLWDRAYENLKAHKTKSRLIDRYERLLSQQMTRNTPITDKLYHGILNDGDGDDDDDTAYPANCISADPRGRHVQLTNMVKQCRKMQKDLIRPTLYAVGDIVSFFDDWITDAIQGSSMASTVWAGVSMFLPLLTNPKKQVDEQLKALTYVTARVSYYEKLELAIGRLPKMDAGVQHEVRARFVKLYQAMIEVLVTGVVHAFGSFKTYLKDALGLGDWKASITRIKALEKTFDKDLSMFRSLMDGEALASLERQAKATSRAMDTLQSIAQESLQQMRLSTVIAQDGLRMQQEDRDAAARKDDMLCLQAFAPEASSGRKTYVDLKDSLAEAVPGTCQWFLRQDKVGAWLCGEKSESVLFLTAGPGCGKSVLSKHMVDSVIPMEDPNATVCYFFFMERVQDSLAQALSSLLHQLLSKNDALIKHARESVKKHKDIAKSPSLLWEVFQKVVNDPESRRLVFVIDALDECDISDLENLVRRLKKLVTTTARRGAVRFLLTSRPWAHVNKAYRPLKNHCIEISGDDFAPEIEHEVGLVTEARIEDFCEGLADNTRAFLRQKLVGQKNASSGRTYLWVHLVFEYLNQTNPIQCTARGLERTLQHLPTTVEDAYANLLEQSLAKVNNREMQDLVVDLVRRAFSIVLAARRPLAVDELREALAMEGGETSLASLDLEEPNEAFADRLNQCCGLMLSFASGTVTFIHQTVIEFLLQSEHPHPRQNTVAEIWRHGFSLQQAHLVLAQVCMNFLLLDEFCAAAAHAPASLPRNRDTVTSSTAHYPAKSPLFDAHPFMAYAGCFWDYHFRLSNAQQDQTLRDQALRLCDIKDFGPRLWILHDCCQHHTARQQLNYDTWHWFDGTFFLFSQLWLYAFAGLDFAVQATLQEAQRELEVQAQTQAREGAQGESIVIAAAAVSTRGNETLKTALLIAAVNGHTSTMELLRTHGADLNMKFTNKWSSNLRGGKAATLLHLIAQCGDVRTLPCLQYLLHAGANVTTPNFRGRTPLHELRHPAIARLMLQYSNRRDLDRRDKQGRTPLRSQLELNQRYGGGGDQGQEIVALMLAHGASVEERAGNGLSPARTSETVLMQARDVGVAELLLSQGADIDATDDDGRTFLMLIVADNEGLAWWDPHARSRQDMALRINRRAVIKLLLARGADNY